MRTALTVISALLLTPAAVLAQQDPQALKVLGQLVDTVNNAKSLSYHTVVVGKGGIFSMLPETTGDVIAARPEGNPKAWKVRITGKQIGVGVDPLDITAVADPSKWAWIDVPARQVVERNAGQEQGNVPIAANALRIRELFEAQPLSKELKCEVIKMEPAVDLDGVKCDVVYTDQGKDQFKGRWFIAQTDHLPRKFEQIMMFQKDVEDKRVWTLTQVKLDVEPPAGSFAISTPEGYTFSPAVAPTPPTPTATPNAIPGTTAPGVPPIPMKKERAVGVNDGDLAPDFDLSTASGEKVRLSSFRGDVVVVDFWGSWHPSAKKCTAEVQTLATQFNAQKVKFLGLAVRETSEAAPAKFFTDNKLTYTLLLKGDEPAKLYRVKKYPTLFVIGREGEVVHTFAGYNDKTTKDIAAEIEKALKAGDAPAKVGEQAPGAAPRQKGQPDNKGDNTGDKDADK